MDIPTDVVLQMRGQGLSNTQIIQSLQRSGYTSQQIADAMAQSEIRYNVEQMPQGGSQEDAGYLQYGQNESANQQPSGEQQFDTSSLQALVEAVIEEKWQDLIRNVSRIAEWKEKTDQRLMLIEQQISDVKTAMDRLHSSILDKIGDYDKTMTSVGTDLKAMEKVFSKILPGFMENVSELSRVTEDLKGLKKAK